ncbi:MAG: LapA family protein [Chromatiales bacterium]|nr:LapA family protein [Chromatiales bacterium]
MIRALLILLLILLAIVVSVLTRLNLEVVNFHYYFGSVALPLMLLLALVFVFGALTGLMLTFALALSTYSERKRLKRALALREQEIRNLRDIPIKDRH